MTVRLLDVDNAALLVVDIQERFLPVIADMDRVLRQAKVLVRAAVEMGVPVLISEQYPKGLGHTVPELLALLPRAAEVVEKTSFGCLGCHEIGARLEALGRRQVILCGIETHVCVNQTAHQLLDEGYEVHLVTDAVASRSVENHTAGITKMIQSGVVTTSTEMAVFELLRDATHPAFKTVQALVK